MNAKKNSRVAIVPEPLTASQAAAIARIVSRVDVIAEEEMLASALRVQFPEHEWRQLVAEREEGQLRWPESSKSPKDS